MTTRANVAQATATTAAMKRLVPLVPLALLLLIVTLPSASPVSDSTQTDIPHSRASSVIAENTHATDQAYSGIGRLVDKLQHDYHVYRRAMESAILQTVRSSNGDNAALAAQIRILVNRLIAELVARVRQRHADMDALLLIAEELHDTNLQQARHVAQVRAALRHMLQLRDTKNGRLDAVLGALQRDSNAVTETKLLALAQASGASDAATATATAATATASSGNDCGDSNVQIPTNPVETIVLQLLDELRAIVHLNRAQCHACLAQQELDFRKTSLLITTAESNARKCA